MPADDAFLDQYDALVSRIAQRLWPYAKRTTDLELEDLLQEGRLRLLEVQDAYDPQRSGSRSAFYGMAVRCRLLDVIRGHHLRGLPRTLRTRPLRFSEVPAYVLDKEPPLLSDAGAARAQQRAELETLLEGLPPAPRTVALWLMDGQPLEEIAACLGFAETYRALPVIRKFLIDSGLDDPRSSEGLKISESQAEAFAAALFTKPKDKDDASLG